jgi:sialate O-acetylesterase
MFKHSKYFYKMNLPLPNFYPWVFKKSVLFLLIWIGCSTVSVSAMLKLPHIFRDGMVLQRNEVITIWGWADKGQDITVKFRNLQKVVKTDESGKWKCDIGVFEAGGPYEMTISADTTWRLNDIHIGEVWLCSGQSNMQYTLDMLGIKTSKADFNSPYPIHFFNVQIETDLIPSRDIAGGLWQNLNEKSAGQLSGTAYYFAKHLQSKLNVPIGIVVSCLGATTVETWMSAEALLPLDAFKSTVELTLAPNKTKIELLKELAEFRIDWDKNYYLKSEGMKEKWYLPENMPKDWMEVKFPLLWEDLGYNHDGEVWFRQNFDCPCPSVGNQGVISLNQIDDYDRVWLNGTFIGESFGSRNFRSYFFPDSLLKEKDNLLVVRVFDVGGKGGVYTNAFWGNKILNGKWEMKMGDAIDLNNFPMPTVPNMSVFSHPTALYNANIAPLSAYKFKGVIWYQGESNADRAAEYGALFPSMIKDWRKLFNKPNLPFHFVQLANYGPIDSLAGPSTWAELRASQSEALNLPFTSLATAIDVGDALDIHPKDKETVGKRLAENALVQDYGLRMKVDAPKLVKSVFSGNGEAVLYFSSRFKPVASGIKINSFTSAGEDGQFFPANAILSGNKIFLKSKEVPNPKYVRFGWANNPGKWTLYGENGRPLLPFRTDRLPLLTAANIFKFDPFSF